MDGAGVQDCMHEDSEGWNSRRWQELVAREAVAGSLVRCLKNRMVCERSSTVSVNAGGRAFAVVSDRWRGDRSVLIAHAPTDTTPSSSMLVLGRELSRMLPIKGTDPTETRSLYASPEPTHTSKHPNTTQHHR